LPKWLSEKRLLPKRRWKQMCHHLIIIVVTYDPYLL
jgi:hypothetical protein